MLRPAFLGVRLPAAVKAALVVAARGRTLSVIAETAITEWLVDQGYMEGADHAQTRGVGFRR